jgi:hypothetical protein
MVSSRRCPGEAVSRQAGGGLGGDAGEPAVAAAGLTDSLGVALDHEDLAGNV